MIFFDKKSFDFNHDLNQWLKSANPVWYYYYILLVAFFQDNLGKPAPER